MSIKLLLFLSAAGLFAQTPTKIDYNTQVKNGPTFSITQSPYLAIADGSGPTGTDQSSKVQLALNALHAAGGGSLFIPPAPKCGTNWPSNLQLLCPACNRAKGAATPEQWEKVIKPRRQKLLRARMLV